MNYNIGNHTFYIRPSLDQREANTEPFKELI